MTTYIKPSNYASSTLLMHKSLNFLLYTTIEIPRTNSSSNSIVAASFFHEYMNMNQISYVIKCKCVRTVVTISRKITSKCYMDVKRGTKTQSHHVATLKSIVHKNNETFFVKCLLKQQAGYITLGSFQTKKVHSGVASSLGQY